MRKLFTTSLVLALLALVGLALTPVFADDSSEARKGKILANLKLTYPSLAEASITMNAIGPSAFSGLDEGSFTHPRGQQKFLVSTDDTKFYMINDPIDVSRSADEINAELAKLDEEKAAKSKVAAAELEASIVGVPTRGNPNGSVTIVEFSDFQCPYCSRGADTMEQVLAKYPNDVKFVFKHFPLDFHPWAKVASIASKCAGDQKSEAFWTLHDKYFEHQKDMTVDNVVEKSQGFLQGSGIDMPKWASCAGDKSTAEYQAAAAAVAADMALGQKLGVSGTPGFFVNGEFLNGAQPINAFEPLIAKAKSQS